jgi:hypothetical protein
MLDRSIMPSMVDTEIMFLASSQMVRAWEREISAEMGPVSSRSHQQGI